MRRWRSTLEEHGRIVSSDVDLLVREQTTARHDRELMYPAVLSFSAPRSCSLQDVTRVLGIGFYIVGWLGSDPRCASDGPVPSLGGIRVLLSLRAATPFQYTLPLLCSGRSHSVLCWPASCSILCLVALLCSYSRFCGLCVVSTFGASLARYRRAWAGRTTLIGTTLIASSCKTARHELNCNVPSGDEVQGVW